MLPEFPDFGKSMGSGKNQARFGAKHKHNFVLTMQDAL